MENKTLCITGDINIDSSKQDSNYNILNYFDMLNIHYFTNAIELPTRITDTSQTLIDHFYCNEPEKKVISSVILSDISDHLPILVSVKNSKEITQKKFLYARNYGKLNNDNFTSDALVTLDIAKNKILAQQHSNTGDKFEILMESLNKIVNNHAPIMKLTRKEAKLKSKPWITRGILKSIKSRNEFYKRL